VKNLYFEISIEAIPDAALTVSATVLGEFKGLSFSACESGKMQGWENAGLNLQEFVTFLTFLIRAASS
jgi:hypothetical protein